MPLNIWTQCGGKSNLRRLAARPWRVVEAQHINSTRKLVDSDLEQGVLESLLEASKPPTLEPRLHFLLATPFRYPPLRYGSRFGVRQERGIWYGAEEQRTAFAETAYYRLLFLAGSSAALAPLVVNLTIFRAAAASRRGVDLTRPPFDTHRRTIASRTHYDATQLLGQSMRADGAEMCRYPSARDQEGGVNMALFSPKAFTRKTPLASQSWRAVVEATCVEVRRLDLMYAGQFRFERAQFEVDGRLPAPAL